MAKRDNQLGEGEGIWPTHLQAIHAAFGFMGLSQGKVGSLTGHCHRYNFTIYNSWARGRSQNRQMYFRSFLFVLALP